MIDAMRLELLRIVMDHRYDLDPPAITERFNALLPLVSVSEQAAAAQVLPADGKAAHKGLQRR